MVWYSHHIDVLVSGHDGHTHAGYLRVSHLFERSLPLLLLLQLVKFEVGASQSCPGNDGQFRHGQRLEALDKPHEMLCVSLYLWRQPPRETDDVLIGVLESQLVPHALLRHDNLQMGDEHPHGQRVHLGDKLQRVGGEKVARLVLGVEEEPEHREEVVDYEVVAFHHLDDVVTGTRGEKLLHQLQSVLHLCGDSRERWLQVVGVVQEFPRYKHSTEIPGGKNLESFSLSIGVIIVSTSKIL